MSRFNRTFIIAAVLATAATASLAALRPPPGGGGGGGGGGSGGGTGGGTVFFQPPSGPPVWTMNSDGSAKTPTLAPFNSVPSRLLHGGQRWYLEMRAINGEFYPTGAERYEFFAVRGDGNSAFTVQLTDQPDLEMDLRQPRFLPGDGAISWVARRWDFFTSTVVEGGVYEADLLYDGDGNIAGLAAQPAAPTFSRPLLPNGQNGNFSLGGDAPDVGTHDWSPAGDAIVLDEQLTTRGLRIADRDGGSFLVYAPDSLAYSAAWSPSGTLIAFNVGFLGREIASINTDGTGFRSLARVSGQGNPNVFSPTWSPTGSHLIYGRGSGSIVQGTYTEDIYRATATGSGKTNLTSDVGGTARPLAWR